ncbi:MAG: hypothetical protein DDT23_00366 [candidate division WS2 bacterium]|nr:hypothetical protein [Candidatus Lithacetigena glycinireducens]
MEVEVRGIKLKGYGDRLKRTKYKGIPKEIRLTAGEKDGTEEVKQITKEIAKAFNSVFGYVAIDHIEKVLKNVSREKIYKNIVWMAKNNEGVMNVDRAGQVVYFRVQGDKGIRVQGSKGIRESRKISPDDMTKGDLVQNSSQSQKDETKVKRRSESQKGETKWRNFDEAGEF